MRKIKSFNKQQIFFLLFFLLTSYPLHTSPSRYLKTFNNHRFKSEDLKQAVPLRSQSQQTEDYTRYTNVDATGLTGVSDTGLVMDPEDKERAVEDLVAFKVSFPVFLFV